MADLISHFDDWSGPLPPCDDCGEQLSGTALEHGRQGFGHYRRCCRCYERRQRGEPPLLIGSLIR